MERVGLEPTTRRIMRSTATCTMRPRCTDGTSYRTDGTRRAGLTEASVHEPVHDHHSDRLTSITERYNTSCETCLWSAIPMSTGSFRCMPNGVACACEEDG